MKTILVLASHPDLAADIRKAVNAEEYRVLFRANIEEAEPLLAHGIAHLCILDVELTDVKGVWLFEKLRHIAPSIPYIVYTSSKTTEWEEEAYLRGATHVLGKPVRPRLLNSLLQRLFSQTAAPASHARPAPVPASHSLPQPSQAHPDAAPRVPAPQSPALGVLRDFSGILTHSLNAEAMLKQFLVLLREILSINRGAIFLRQPIAAFADPTGSRGADGLRLTSSIGVSAALLQSFELSLESGIGGQVFRLGRILRRNSDEIRNDPNAQKEFDLLNGQVAIPILDRESVLGVAVFDGRITGEPLVNSELELIFHLLEQLGLAVKNIWLHSQLTANHEMMAGILRELSSACVVVGRDLTILHANRTARRYFSGSERGGEFEFSDLPQTLGSRVYQVLKTGAGIASFKYEPEDTPGTVYSVSVVPFQRAPDGLPLSALLMAEDLTQGQQYQKLEIEAANLRLVRSMADRLTHEIGNAMVPLSTHQQLLADKWQDPEFRVSLNNALGEGVKRVNRLINQMRFLAREPNLSTDAFPIGPLLEEAFQEARRYQPVKAAQLKYDSSNAPVSLTGDRAALKHAFTEVMLNALQANPAEPRIGVRLNQGLVDNGSGVQIEVQDNGAGFSAEAARKADAPFFTTRNVGLGLGLTVTRKIIETHHGKLEILNPKSGEAGVVRISLPVEAGNS
ncbi:MAG TPA: ATP-binding protein [Verrucomicrobiae bacterium]|nr:ATP-binding protein [Verrucomicrobiae bacterium]